MWWSIITPKILEYCQNKYIHRYIQILHNHLTLKNKPNFLNEAQSTRHCGLIFFYNGLVLKVRLVVIIFYCSLENMKKLIKSSISQEQSTIRGILLYFLHIFMVVHYLLIPIQNVCKIGKIFFKYWGLCLVLFLMDDIVKNMKLRKVFDRM